eukprot:1190330-Prorocentrum_minimum.AAC.3
MERPDGVALEPRGEDPLPPATLGGGGGRSDGCGGASDGDHPIGDFALDGRHRGEHREEEGGGGQVRGEAAEVHARAREVHVLPDDVIRLACLHHPAVVQRVRGGGDRRPQPSDRSLTCGHGRRLAPLRGKGDEGGGGAEGAEVVAVQVRQTLPESGGGRLQRRDAPLQTRRKPLHLPRLLLVAL